MSSITISNSVKTVPIPALKNILFATDFSSCSQAALPFLHALAMRHGSTVHIVHVIAPEVRGAVPMDRLPELDVDQSDAESAMKAMQASQAFLDIAHTATVERGEVWEVLASIVEERKIDLIVVGTHGRRGLTKLVIGSTAEQVFRHAPCPVLTVGPHSTNQEMARGGVAPILFATDFSRGSQHALPYAVSLARANHAQLILLHAVSPSLAVLPGSMEGTLANADVPAKLIADAVAYARKQMAEMIPPGIMQELKPEIIAECAPAAEVIVGTAENRRAALIVMGAHRSSQHSVAAHLPWATASAVVCRAPCPVLTVRS